MWLHKGAGGYLKSYWDLLGPLTVCSSLISSLALKRHESKTCALIHNVFRTSSWCVQKTCRKRRGVEDLKIPKLCLAQISSRALHSVHKGSKRRGTGAGDYPNPRSLHLQFLKQSDVHHTPCSLHALIRWKGQLLPNRHLGIQWNILLAARTKYYNCLTTCQIYRCVIKVYQKLGSQACCQKKTLPYHKAKTDETDSLSRYIAMLAYRGPSKIGCAHALTKILSRILMQVSSVLAFLDRRIWNTLYQARCIALQEQTVSVCRKNCRIYDQVRNSNILLGSTRIY